MKLVYSEAEAGVLSFSEYSLEIFLGPVPPIDNLVAYIKRAFKDRVVITYMLVYQALGLEEEGDYIYLQIGVNPGEGLTVINPELWKKWIADCINTIPEITYITIGAIWGGINESTRGLFDFPYGAMVDVMGFYI